MTRRAIHLLLAATCLIWHEGVKYGLITGVSWEF